MSKLGEFNHIEFPADDLERAKTFYSTVFGWQFTAMDGYDDYYLYEAGPGQLGGGFGVRNKSAGPTIRNYLATPDIDATLEKAAANGGTVTEPKTDIGFGWYAVLRDTEGSEIAVYQAKPRE
jgi:predicted enzyme related to lactoylglutathione lyase